MDRLKLWLLPLYAVLGFVAILFIVPTSRWIVLRQIDLLAGFWQGEGWSSGPDGRRPYMVHPLERGIEGDHPDDNDTVKFLRVSTFDSRFQPQDVQEQKLRSIYAYCLRANSAPVWGAFVTHLTLNAQVNDVFNRKTDPAKSRYPAVQRLLRDACLQGEKVDPNNLMFTVILAGTLNRLGDAGGARATFIRASTKTSFDDYSGYESHLRYQYLVDHYGYRGNLLKVWILTHDVGTNVAYLHTLTQQFFTNVKDLDVRLAGLKIASVIMNHNKTSGLAFYERLMFQNAIAPSGTWRYRDISEPELNRLARHFEKQYGHGLDLTKEVAEYNLTRKSQSDVFKEARGVQDLSETMQPVHSSWSLLTIFTLNALLGVVWAKTKNADISAASPYLLWIIAFFADVAFRANFGTSGATIYGFAALLFFIALFPKARRYADCIGLAIGIFIIGCIFGIPGPKCFPLAVVAGLFLVGLALERLLVEPPTWIRSVALTLAALTAAFIVVSEAILPAHGSDWGGLPAGAQIWIILWSIIGVSGLIPSRGTIRWQPLIGSAFLLIGIFYATMVSIDLSYDRQLAVVYDRLKLSEGLYWIGQP